MGIQTVQSERAAEAGAFVGKLVEWQGALGLHDAAFARHLGISRSYWSMLKRGGRPGGFRSEKLLRRVLREKPEFEFYVTADLRAQTARGAA